MDCERAGEEFILYIDKLMAALKPSSRLGSAQSSVKIKWHHNQIEAYVSRLDRLQGVSFAGNSAFSTYQGDWQPPRGP